MIFPLLPALAAMTFWYVQPLQSALTGVWRGSDPWGGVCAFLTGIQVCSVVATTILWRSLRPWAYENAWEFLVLFQLNGNRRLDLYPIVDYTILEDARLFVAAGSLALIAFAELTEQLNLLYTQKPGTSLVRLCVGQVSRLDPSQTLDAAQIEPHLDPRPVNNPCTHTPHTHTLLTSNNNNNTCTNAVNRGLPSG